MNESMDETEAKYWANQFDDKDLNALADAGEQLNEKGLDSKWDEWYRKQTLPQVLMPSAPPAAPQPLFSSPEKCLTSIVACLIGGLMLLSLVIALVCFLLAGILWVAQYPLVLISALILLAAFLGHRFHRV
jgi:hypothetical protein